MQLWTDQCHYMIERNALGNLGATAGDRLNRILGPLLSAYGTGRILGKGRSYSALPR